MAKVLSVLPNAQPTDLLALKLSVVVAFVAPNCTICVIVQVNLHVSVRSWQLSNSYRYRKQDVVFAENRPSGGFVAVLSIYA